MEEEVGRCIQVLVGQLGSGAVVCLVISDTSLLQCKDVVSIALTGSGKTLTFLMPLLFNGGKVTIVVTALNVLGDQLVKK